MHLTVTHCDSQYIVAWGLGLLARVTTLLSCMRGSSIKDSKLDFEATREMACLRKRESVRGEKQDSHIKSCFYCWTCYKDRCKISSDHEFAKVVIETREAGAKIEVIHKNKNQDIYYTNV
ncbi:hypothetical protein F5146DRAFT_1005486 [Armillaria mellea]|nr:hypothetical protein F5146DRAFT_1005486 [Armillaria mellea]